MSDLRLKLVSVRVIIPNYVGFVRTNSCEHRLDQTALNMTGSAAADEVTPLLRPKREDSSSSSSIAPRDDDDDHDDRRRVALHLFLEARTIPGLLYEKFTISLILLSVSTFVLSSLYVPEYNVGSNLPYMCDGWCDALWFGNRRDNALEFLGIGSTSVVEILVVGIFSIDYLMRLYVADLEDPRYKGMYGRLKYIPTFFSLVDLASTVPFYVDSFLLPNQDLAASNYLRMFRLLRMMKVEGRYDMAISMIDDVLYAQRGILGTALFVGVTVWGVVSLLA